MKKSGVERGSGPALTFFFLRGREQKGSPARLCSPPATSPMWRWLAAANGGGSTAGGSGPPSTSSRGGSSDNEAPTDDAAAVVAAAVAAAARGPLAAMAGVAFFRLSDRLIGFSYGENGKGGSRMEREGRSPENIG